MHRRIKASTANLHLVDNEPMLLNYYILISTGYKTDDKTPIRIYGCEVESEYPDSDREPEVKSFAGIFQSRREIEEFVEKLRDGHVTPCTLYDLVYDYISR